MSRGAIKLNVGSIYTGMSSVTKNKKKYGPNDYRYYGLVKPTTDIEVKEFIEDNLFIYKEGKTIPIKVSRKMLEFICDYYFERERFGILWKNRGGSGTLSASIIMFLKIVFQKSEITNMAGSVEQAKNAYKYVIGFITKSIPGLSTMIDGKPTKTELFLKNGGKIKVITASEQQARGIHYRILILDEACQKNPAIAPIMKSAINTVFSEKNCMILMLSTFHAEEVLFSDYWDNAEKRGYKRYHWTIYDSMETCHKPTDQCESCPLTRIETVIDKKGNVIGKEYLGCYGAAHTSDGYMTFTQVLDTYLNHSGREEEYMIEHESRRPIVGGGLQYSAYDILKCENMDYYVDENDDSYFVTVGIDWGYDAQTAIVAGEYPCYLSEEKDKFGWPRVAIDYLYYKNRKSIEHIISILVKIENFYGVSKEKIVVRADSSHPFENQELRNAGYNVKPIAFKKYKELGIKNVSMFLKHNMLILYSNYKERDGIWEVARYLMRYRKLPNGKYNRDDHIPDAVLCLLTKFNFLQMYSNYLRIYREEKEND